MKKSILLLIIAITSAHGSQEPVPLTSVGIKEIIKEKDRYDLTNFKTFLRGVRRSSGKNSFMDETITTEITGRNRIETVNLSRLLGLYARLKYAEEITGLLSEMVSLETYRRPGVPQRKNPQVARFGKLLERTAGKLGLEYRNRENWVFEVLLRGSGKESLGVYAHCDTVPAEKKGWVLDDGRTTDPFRLTIAGSRIYGRGVLDDKGSVAIALYSLKTVRESGIRLKRTIRLIIGTSEETGSHGLRYYRKRFGLPEYNVVLDNYYPATLSEKGYGQLTVSFREKRGRGRGPEIVNVTGASASNMVPGSSTATIRTADPGKLERLLAAQSKGYTKEKGKGLTFTFRKGKGRLLVKAKGVSAHSSEPQYGANPVQGIFCFLHESAKKFRFRKNRFTSAAAYISEKLGTGYSGEKLGITFNREETGPFTAVLTQVSKGRGKLDLVINLRIPYGMNRDELKRQIKRGHEQLLKRRGRSLGYRLFLGKPFRSGAPDGFIRILVDTFNGVTGLQVKPTGAGGSTAAKYLPRAISFGPCYPGEKCPMHVENEYRERERFLTDIQLITEMILRAGNY